LRKGRFCILFVLFNCAIANVILADESSGDEKIKDTKKHIEETISENEDDSDAAASAEDNDGEQSLADHLFELIFKI
jgi:hypothetical protein